MVGGAFGVSLLILGCVIQSWPAERVRVRMMGGYRIIQNDETLLVISFLPPALFPH